MRRSPRRRWVPVRPARTPLETVVYVDRQGAVVRSRGDRLIVTDGEESLLRLNLRRVRQVVCFGRIGLTTPLLHKAAERGIEIVLLTENGTLGARLTPPPRCRIPPRGVPSTGPRMTTVEARHRRVARGNPWAGRQLQPRVLPEPAPHGR